MSLKKLPKILNNSYKEMTNNLGRCVLIATIDAVFVILASIALSFFFRMIADPLAKLLGFAMNQKDPSPEVSALVTGITSIQDVLDIWNNIFWKFALFFLGIILLWGFMQSVSWHISKAISGSLNILKLKKYMLRFSIVSLIIFGISFLIGFFAIKYSFASGIYAAIVAAGFTMSGAQQAILIFGGLIIAILLAVLPIVYSSLFSQDIKNSLLNGFKELFSKRFFTYVIIYAGFSILFFVSQKIQGLLATFNTTVMFLFGLIVDIGLLIMFRLIFIKLTKHEKKN